MLDHVVVLTGASRGLGAALAQQLLSPSTHLVCVARSKNDPLAKAAKEGNAWLDYYLADLTDIKITEELATSICESLPADVARYTLINNAGMLGPVDKAETLTANEIAKTLHLNVVAAMTFTAQFLAVTKGYAAERRVLNISSGAGRRAVAGWSVYCASKAALDMATRCAVLDETDAVRPARFVSLAPGLIDTEMQSSLRTADAAVFPERQRFIDLKAKDELTSPKAGAERVLRYLERPDFGQQPLADVRDA